LVDDVIAVPPVKATVVLDRLPSSVTVTDVPCLNVVVVSVVQLALVSAVTVAAGLTMTVSLTVVFPPAAVPATVNETGTGVALRVALQIVITPCAGVIVTPVPLPALEELELLDDELELPTAELELLELLDDELELPTAELELLEELEVLEELGVLTVSVSVTIVPAVVPFPTFSVTTPLTVVAIEAAPPPVPEAVTTVFERSLVSVIVTVEFCL
jgi:hypothetical protein